MYLQYSFEKPSNQYCKYIILELFLCRLCGKMNFRRKRNYLEMLFYVRNIIQPLKIKISNMRGQMRGTTPPLMSPLSSPWTSILRHFHPNMLFHKMRPFTSISVSRCIKKMHSILWLNSFVAHFSLSFMINKRTNRFLLYWFFYSL